MKQKQIYSGFGCEVFDRDGRFFIRYDSGASAGSRYIEHEISKDEVEKTRRSERDAYEVILAAQQRDSK
jgi:hypothetical protein